MFLSEQLLTSYLPDVWDLLAYFFPCSNSSKDVAFSPICFFSSPVLWFLPQSLVLTFHILLYFKLPVVFTIFRVYKDRREKWCFFSSNVYYKVFFLHKKNHTSVNSSKSSKWWKGVSIKPGLLAPRDQCSLNRLHLCFKSPVTGTLTISRMTKTVMGTWNCTTGGTTKGRKMFSTLSGK